MKKQNKKVILVGKGGAGKDFLASHLVSTGYTKDISYTTRPPREGEVNGVDYHFVEKSYFRNLMYDNFFYETAKFNGWYYGTTRESWGKADLFIMTPTGVSEITKKDKSKCVIVYLDIDEGTRRERLGKRVSPPDSIEHRLKADEEDFKKLDQKGEFFVKISDPNFNLKETEKNISFIRRIQFLEHIPNLFVTCFATFFYICLGFIYEDFIKGMLLLTIVCFTIPAAMILAAMYQWYSDYYDA